MNWCKPHWDRLRTIIKDKGMDGFVAKNSEAAVDHIAGKDKSFEPLLGSWMRINETFLKSPACNGRVLECPLCALVTDGRPELVDDWLDGVTDDALNYALGAGLIKKS